MTAAVAILARQRGDIHFVYQSLYDPVTDAAQDTDRYRELANGPFLTARGMAWLWDASLLDHTRRAEITVSPTPGTDRSGSSKRSTCSASALARPGERQRRSQTHGNI